MATKIIPKKPAVPQEPPPLQRPHTEARQQDQQEAAESRDNLQKAIMEFPGKGEPKSLGTELPPPIADDAAAGTPVGGKKKEDEPVKPPEAIVTPPPSQAGEIETDEQIDARLDEYKPRNKSEEQGLMALKKVVKEKNTLARNKSEEAAALQKKIEELTGKVLPEDELNHLRALEKDYSLREVESLPRWKEYDKAIEQVGKSAHDLLISFADSPEAKERQETTLKAIADRGGIIKFSESKAPAGEQWKNEDGTPMTEAQWFRKQIYDKLDRRQQNQFDALTTEAYTKQREKDSALAEAKEKADETLKEENKKFWDAFNAEANSTVAELIKTELKRFDFPDKPPEILPDDTKEVKEQKQKDLDAWNKADKDVPKYASVVTAKDRATVGFKAALYDALAERYQDRKKGEEREKARADQLQEQLDGIKESRRLKPRAGPVKGALPERDDMELTTEEALQKAGFPA